MAAQAAGNPVFRRHIDGQPSAMHGLGDDAFKRAAAQRHHRFAHQQGVKIVAGDEMIAVVIEGESVGREPDGLFQTGELVPFLGDIGP